MRIAPSHLRVAALSALVLAIIVALKQYYRGATADELSWILAPTAWLVSAITDVPFVFEAGTGWFSQEEMFAIAPECAGVHFMLAAFLTLSLVALSRLRDTASALMAIALSLVLAYAATLMVNALRIAVALRADTAGSFAFDGHALHRAQGIAVFFSALIALYWVAERIFPKALANA